MALSDEKLEGIAWQEILGYLNFSSGATDPAFLKRLSELWEGVEGAGIGPEQSHAVIADLLKAKLEELSASQPTFKNADQGRAVLRLTFEGVLPAYRNHHRDLLFHQTPGSLWRPYFVGRAIEAILTEGAPWEEDPRIVEGALRRLNDYVGYRPVPVLETHRHEPYPHERLRPIPLYIAGAGVAAGKYAELIETTLKILNETDREVLESAWFDPKVLDELALDPRAYDFNHPADRRPNHHFGQWDMHLIDNQGRYRRFVLQQTALDAIWERVEQTSDIPHDELVFEAAAVLAGTILMASGTTGAGPETHDSSVTLGTLLPHIAAYRDEFYRRLFGKLKGPHLERLKKEAEAKQQPFAGARQHLNAQLARRRALQIQHVALASQFARLGFPEAAMRQAEIVPAASARMVCQMQCLLTSGRLLTDRGKLEEAAATLPQVEDLLRRAIDCGAVIDPWNILGFGGQFSLFPAIENSTPDDRVDELLELMEQLFALYARLWHELATSDNPAMMDRVQLGFQQIAKWWDQFATASALDAPEVMGSEAYAAAERVAKTLAAWHQAGEAAGNIAFWRPLADEFQSAQSYGSVIEVLLAKGDWQASAALLMHWLSRAGEIGLGEGGQSFYTLAMRWMQSALHRIQRSEATENDRAAISKFFDYLEANAEEFWEVPQWELSGAESMADIDSMDEEDEDDEQDEDEGLFSAAYEGMVYRDSTGDGIEADMLEGPSASSDDELEWEHHRLSPRLGFLAMLATLWKLTAVVSVRTKAIANLSEADSESKSDEAQARFTPAVEWTMRAAKIRHDLEALALAIQRHPVHTLSAAPDALMEYDRRRMLHETLLEKVIATTVAVSEAGWYLAAAADLPPLPENYEELKGDDAESQTVASVATMATWRAVLLGDVKEVRRHWAGFLADTSRRSLLYVPLSRGGGVSEIILARTAQFVIRELLGRLPRLGLLRETCQLLRVARAMEKNHSPGAGAVTEFDGLFEIGYQAIVESLVESSKSWNQPTSKSRSGRSKKQAKVEAGAADAHLIECLQIVTESLLSEWLSHSRTLRLSVLERVSSPKAWNEVVRFIERYGNDLFTQSFFHLGNLRAILHQGVDVWIDQLKEDEDDSEPYRFIAELDKQLSRSEARRQLTLIIEAIVENYAEYRDYNATTTQSDRGEMLYILLDFLRLKVAYERIHWNLRPVMMAHEVLIRCGCDGAAELWRRAMAERTAEAADQQLQRLTALQNKYGIRLSSITDRLSERFVRPLLVDRLRTLVRPAAEEARRGDPPMMFALLEEEAGQLAEEPCGAGLVTPDWLDMLEDEVLEVSYASWKSDLAPLNHAPPWTVLTWDEIQAQLTDWDSPSQGE